jgi:glycosyltransferase involved in cell wall biosynthesis
MFNIKIITPLYNVEKWISVNIESILSQTYKNFSCYYIDDMSTDSSVEIIKKYTDDRINLIQNKEKKFALRNIYEAISNSNAGDEDIIIILDGDDWLANKNVLEKIVKYYEKEDIYLTYGNYIEYPSGNRPRNVTRYSDHIVKHSLYRKDIWRASHLRTFKYKLWKNIKVEDLKDKEGNFYKMTGDLATMFPMLEMSGGKFKCVDEILCCYNVSNPLNDHKVDHSLQLSIEYEIRNKKPYSELLLKKNET